MIDHHREAIPLIPTHSKTFSNMLNVGWLLGYADVCRETAVTCGAVTLLLLLLGKQSSVIINWSPFTIDSKLLHALLEFRAHKYQAVLLKTTP